MKPVEHTGTSNGAEDIDEFRLTIDGVTVHIEKMAPNEYFIGIDGKLTTATLYIGHWPRNPKKQGKLKLNIFENPGGTWTY